MSRGAWFEQTMEAAAPRLRRGLLELRRNDTAGVGTPAHVPYLLLNATWVETGERAIASELRIDQADFPGSKDQLDLLGTDMPLGAAAHNAARFPYINAIGGLRTPVSRCDRRAGEKALAPGAAQPASKTVVCGHLADGGYFDNGGAQTTSDVIHALVRCLDKAQPCPGLPDAHRDWLRQHLVPTVLMIRNESRPDEALADQCTEVTQPTKAEVDPAQAAECAANIGERYRPGRPICERGKVPYLDLVGPALAVFNTSGIGAAGRLAEARQATAIAQARQAMGSDSAAARQNSARSVIALDLLPKGVKLPLGWHLSRKAVGDIESQARSCRIGNW